MAFCANALDAESKDANTKARNLCILLSSSWPPCPFRKSYPTWIRIVRQNHRIIESDVCDPARARNVRHRPIQVGAGLKLRAHFSYFNSTVLDQRLTNDTTQPNRNKRRQTSSNATLIVRFFRLFRGGRTAHNGLVAPYPWCVADFE